MSERLGSVPPPLDDTSLSPSKSAAEKVSVPGIFLLLAGIVGAVGAALCVFEALLEMAGVRPGPVDRSSIPVGLAFFVVATAANVFIAVGATKMRRLSSFPIAMGAAIAAMVPGFGPCLCIVGLPVGLWCLIVLLKPDVRAAFH